MTVMFSLLSIGSASLALDNWDGAVSVALNLVASAIAFCAGLAFRSLYERVARKREAEAQRRLIQTGASAWTFPWLESYYLKRGSVDDMYVAKLADGQLRLPILMRPEWVLDTTDLDSLVVVDDSPQPIRALDAPTLKRRGLSVNSVPGEWNARHACALRIGTANDAAQVVAGTCDYKEYISTSGRLEDEAKAAIEAGSSSAPFRDQRLSGRDVLQFGSAGTHSIGMVTAVIVRVEGTDQVLLHRRSAAVSTYPGSIGLIPMFGCQPTEPASATQVSLRWNFLREVYEELFGGHEAQRPTLRPSADWFMADSRMEWFEEEVLSSYPLRVLGYGLDALNGQLIFGSAIHIKDEAISQRLLMQILGNWEMDSMHLVDLNGSEMNQLLRDRTMVPACAFTIARCREVLTVGA